GGVLATYPDPLLTRLSSEAADAFLHAGQPDFAQGLLDRLVARLGAEAESVPMMQYLRGEVARLRDDHELAKEMLTAAYGSLDRLVRAKAGLALTNLERADGTLSTDGAVDRLAGLTFIWRGDELEMDIRQRLGEIYVESGRFADGFASLRETAAMQPNSPRAAAIANFMQRTFAELFKDGGTKMPVLDAMAFYDQYRELTPVGEEGDEVIRQLAERLAAIDLLARASDLYEHQVRFRLSGLDKARAGTRLASLRLLDNKPEDAIRALELSNVAGLPADLDAERRTMHAKALAEMGREQEALQLLAKDDSRPADLLRVDIAWRAQKWEQAAIALSKVIGRPPANGKPLDPPTSQLVLNRAVALALAGDGTGLNTMRKDFGAVMAAGPDADAFRILTRPEQATGLIDVDTIRSRVAEVDMFQNFLKGYRSRIGQQGSPQGGQPAAPNS
ncbi:MAG TPA: tetratricopeptide repeat protein, partial [Azospirillaceae bacterium]|nr:tetratricopeptide repeat protein [Azospirillaceae bacterium]